MRLFLLRFLALVLFAFALPSVSIGQTKPVKPVFVIVHGAWGGSWAYKKVDSLLTEKGMIVYRPSLTGLGERVHLATGDVGLQTHINDVVNEILFEDLHDIILVGHSYGGMVITGVADSLPGRIRKMIYLDAFFPNTGESVFSINPSAKQYWKSRSSNGFMIPPWTKPDAPFPHDVPHPFKAFDDTLVLKHKTAIPTIYVQTVVANTDPAKDDFASQAERAKKKGIKVVILEADHNPQWSAVQPLVDLLYSNK